MAIEGQKTMSKTQHYRKVTKPLLERKRRARMNHYLDELKGLIIETMESNGEHVTKLEKADILELTVEYLKSKKEQQYQQKSILEEGKSSIIINGDGNEGDNTINVEKFRAGYTQAAYEVSKVFSSVPEINVKFGSRLMKHLAYQLKDLYPSSFNEHECINLVSTSSSVQNYRGFHPYRRQSQEQQQQQQQQYHFEQLEKHLPTANEVWRPW